MKGNIGNILLLADQRTAGCWFYLCFTLVCAHSVSAQSSSALPLLSASAPVEPNDIKHSINIPIYQVAMAQLPDVVEQQAGAVGSRLVPLRQCRTYRPPLASVLQASRPAKAPDAGVGSSSTSSPPPATAPADKPAHDVVAGAMARAASQSTIHPLDTMKVRMQAGSLKGSAAASAVASSGSMQLGASRPDSLTQSLQRGMSEVASLYKGVLSAATGAGIIIGAYFAFYSTSKRFLRERTDWKEGQLAFVSGATAAVGSGVVKVPIAVCIRSVQAGVYPNVVQAARSIVQAAGFRGLFTGFLPTLLEDVPDMAVKFAVYETLRPVHSRLSGGRQPSTLEDLVMGGSAGAAAAAATTPLDVLKTRMMCSASSRPTLLGAARSVLAEGEGMRAFFKGVGPRALSNGLNSAVFFCFFEAIRRLLVQRQQQQAAAQQLPLMERAPLQAGTTGQQPLLHQLTTQEQKQQPVLALSCAEDPSPVSSSSSQAVHISRRGSQGCASGSGKLACLSLALPLPGQAQSAW